MSDDLIGVTRELTNILMDNNQKIQDRIVEICAVFEEYTPKIRMAERTIENLQAMLETQKSLMIEFQKTEESTTKVFKQMQESRAKQTARLFFFSAIIVLVAFISGFLFSEFYFQNRCDNMNTIKQEKIDDSTIKAQEKRRKPK